MDDVIDERPEVKDQAGLADDPTISTEQIVNGILDVAELVPVPMVKTISKTVRTLVSVFKAGEPDPIETKLNEISQKLSNMTAVVFSAVTKVRLNIFVTDMKTNYEDILRYIKNEDSDDQISAKIEKVSADFNQIVAASTDLVAEYEGLMKTEEIVFSDYIQQYLLFNETLLKNATVAIETCALADAYAKSKRKKNKKLFDKIRQTCADIVESIETKSNNFSKGEFVTNLPKWMHYDKWSTGIYLQNAGADNKYIMAFEGKSGYINRLDVETKDYTTKDWKSYLTFHLDYKQQNPEIEDSPYLWQIRLVNNRDNVVSFCEYDIMFSKKQIETYREVYLLNLISPKVKVRDHVVPDDLLHVNINLYTAVKTFDDYLVFKFIYENNEKSLDRNKGTLKYLGFNTDKSDQRWKILDNLPL